MVPLTAINESLNDLRIDLFLQNVDVLVHQLGDEGISTYLILVICPQYMAQEEADPLAGVHFIIRIVLYDLH